MSDHEASFLAEENARAFWERQAAVEAENRRAAFSREDVPVWVRDYEAAIESHFDREREQREWAGR